MINVLVFIVCFTATSGYALIFGGGTERTGALLLISAACLTFFVQGADFEGTFDAVAIGLFVVDATLFVGLVALALGSDRFWPIWLSGLQLVQVAAHAAQALSPTIMPLAYASMLAMWSYPMLVILAVATWRHRKRMAQSAAALI